MLSTNKDRSSLLLGDLGELAEVENEDLHQLLEVFQYEDFFSRNSIIVEVGKTSTLSQEGSLLKLQRFLVLCRQ